MEAKKDIGKAFREKMDSLDRQPNDALWGAISQSLDEKEKKKKFPFFWLYILSCTVIGITAIAFVLSNLAGSNKNNPDIKPTGIENTISAGESITKGSSASDKKNAGEAALSNKRSADDSISDESVSSVSGNENANEQNGGVSVATTTQKNKASQSKTLQSNTPHNSTENEGYATGNGHNSRAKNRKQSSKTSAVAATGAGQTAGNSNNKQPQSYAQTGKKTATSPGNSVLPTDSEKNSNNNSISQTADKTMVANTTGTTEPSSNNNNLSSDKENISSSIDSKNIGSLNTLAATDSTKTVADSLKTPITDIKEEEKKEDKKDSIPPVPFKKFSVFAYGGPSYFTFPDRTIVTDSTTSGINTKSTTRFGVMFGYRFSNKLSVRMGVSSYKLKQSASGIKLNYVMEGGTPTNPAELIPTPDFTWIDYQQPFGTNSGVIISTLGDNYQAIINIDRELSYIEIPLELSYNLFDKRFGVDVFAGGSMLLLNKNKVTAYNEMGQMYLGEWNAAAKTSFTATLGLGLHYKFTSSLQLNAEPVFNYYFNTYKDSKPYSFTFRLGLQYDFDF